MNQQIEYQLFQIYDKIRCKNISKPTTAGCAQKWKTRLTNTYGDSERFVIRPAKGKVK